MRIVRSRDELKPLIKVAHAKGNSIGFVPTMGYLHEGHLSLVQAARSNNDIVVVSIFVNPTQFAPNEDLEQYPRDEKRDLDLLRSKQTDIVFIPEVEEIYPEGFGTYVLPPPQSRNWEGASRPIHFQGVCTVVSILFNLVQPTHAYFGRKDAQQASVIKQMTRDLKFPVEICVEPIVREHDGLALSSRNIYLSDSERQDALVLSRALKKAVKHFREGQRDSNELIEEAEQEIKSISSVRLDYIGIVDQNTFQSVDCATAGDLIIGAIFIGKIRLIDNFELNES